MRFGRVLLVGVIALISAGLLAGCGLFELLKEEAEKNVIEETYRKMEDAWAAKNVDLFMSYFAQDFRYTAPVQEGQGGGFRTWQDLYNMLSQMFSDPSLQSTSIKFSDLEIDLDLKAGKATADTKMTVNEVYIFEGRQETHGSEMDQTHHWEKRDDKWMVVEISKDITVREW
ncbi:MAG: nuclear transport factor 2 family protein [bacterium]